MINGGDDMELLTVKETADMLRVSPVTVRRYIASGKLAAVRVGRNIRIRRDAVERLLSPTWAAGRSKFADKSDVWLLENHPLMQMNGMIKDDGPTDYSVNHDKYLADAYADTHEDSGENIVTPTKLKMPKSLDAAALERLQNHPYMKLIGLIDDDGPNDYSINHDKYLADEHADTHEE
jgi:excisionase family DNA binding protein